MRVNGNRSGRCWKHCPWVRRKKNKPVSSQWKDIISEKREEEVRCHFTSELQKIHLLILSLHQFSSVQFSPSVLSDSLRPHGLQHARLLCPLPAPGACSNSCPSSQWCHPTISSSVVPFSSCLHSCAASRSFLMSQFFASGGQSIGASASASVLPMIFRTGFF